MTLTKFSADTKAKASEVNGNINGLFSVVGKNHIRSLFDKVGVYSAGEDDGWGEVYTNINGENSSLLVNDSNSTALISANNVAIYPTFSGDEASGDTTTSSGNWTNPSNAFDGNDATYANNSFTDTAETLGKTFGAKTVYGVKVKGYVSSSTTGKTITLQTYNGSGWNDFVTVATFGSGVAGTFEKYIYVNSSIQGVRVKFQASGAYGTVGRLYTLEYSSSVSTGDSLQYHDIPSGMFSSTISSAIGVPFFENWETGADVQYKLTNTTEDSGWLDCGNSPEISSFTAFTSEPTTLIVKLIPKATTPTAGYPAIKGFWVKGE